MSEDKPLVNRVANSGIITLDLEKWYPSQAFVHIDIKDYLFKGLILKEKDFREALKEINWEEHRDKICEEQYELESFSKELKAVVKRVLPNGGGE